MYMFNAKWKNNEWLIYRKEKVTQRSKRNILITFYLVIFVLNCIRFFRQWQQLSKNKQKEKQDNFCYSMSSNSIMLKGLVLSQHVRKRNNSSIRCRTLETALNICSLPVTYGKLENTLQNDLIAENMVGFLLRLG